MDPDRIKRRQSLKIIISETLMVLSVILMVIILAFLVSGYWINSDFKVERQGLLQISSIPTGADVYIDDNSSWLQKTNTSKVLPSGEHTVRLHKEGYDSWTKKVNIAEGLLYRVHYPRLFPTEMFPEKVLEIPDIDCGIISPDRKTLLFTTKSLEWGLVDLNNDSPKSTNFSIADLIGAKSLDGDFNPISVTSANWDSDSSHVLMQIKFRDVSNWLLIDVSNPNNSVNLSEEFKIDFRDIKILDNSSNNLLVADDSGLRKIDISGRSISSVLVEDVISFDHYNNEIVFVAKKVTSGSEKDASPYYLGRFKIGNSQIVKLQDLSSPSLVTISQFYDEKYISLLEDDMLNLYKDKDFTKVFDFKLNFIPENIEVGHQGEFIIMTEGEKIASLDMEARNVLEWQLDTKTYGWIDDDMVYTAPDGVLTVYDYDGLNRRQIIANVTGSLPVTITNNKWLYFFDDRALMRAAIND